ncbi:MAG: hypothetical protein K1X89_31105, partial [Myxococcaceae bacterium]|nr:hypothetical protein [Myxococcaceae bacterium]
YYDGGCGPIDAGTPPLPRMCAPPTASECNGGTDSALMGLGVGASRLNGSSGNGFDDDCDGLVDEGCSCPGNGSTKDCYLVPATMATAQGTPAGWCASNSKGSLDCSGGELPSWSGVCRGALPPNAHEVCQAGDFNCDGLDGNSDIMGCNCSPPATVTCPTTTRTLSPYPDATMLPLVDGSLWVSASARAQTTNWTWTVVGGDCDNVLPHPTFALYSGPNSATAGGRKGARATVRIDPVSGRLVTDAAAKLASIRADAFGNGVAGGQVYPAFALSGDYVMQGEFDLDGAHYTCTQKVAVRAPGIRAELCWDTVGGDNGTNGNDIDIHFARLQGVSCAKKGWNLSCKEGATYEDCYYDDASGCTATATTGPVWGYAVSPRSACVGWGSKRLATDPRGCTNPRLDADNVSCDRAQADPTAIDFCGPENINLDNPKDLDAFVVGVNHYGNNAGTAKARPHVNLYCNGARVLSVGYNPVTSSVFPALTKPGADSGGDWWTVATIKAHVDAQGALTSCDVGNIPSHHADPNRDGPVAVAGDGNQICVDSKANTTPAPNQYSYTSKQFVEAGSAQSNAAGSIPSSRAQFCKH